jgi:hypothetical protein
MPYHVMKRPRSRNAIKELLLKIAERHGLRRWEPPLCERLDIGPYAPRNWLERGIPEGYWPAVAELAGVPLADVRAAHKVIRAR